MSSLVALGAASVIRMKLGIPPGSGWYVIIIDPLLTILALMVGATFDSLSASGIVAMLDGFR